LSMALNICSSRRENQTSSCSVRLNCTLTQLFGPQYQIWNLIDLARKYKVEQLTIRNVTKPVDCQDPEVEKWIDENKSLINLIAFSPILLSLYLPVGVWSVKAERLRI
jgi:hypothetical protein